MEKNCIPSLGSRAGDWTGEELELLRSQLEEGRKLREIRIPNRTTAAVDNQMRRWRLHTKGRWTQQEKALLRKQVEGGVIFKALAVPGRSKHAVAAMYAGLFGVRRKPWSGRENQELLQKLAVDPEAKDIAVPGRTADAVKRRLYELGWHSPARYYWTPGEDRTLRDQLVAGVAVTGLAVEGRTKVAAHKRAVRAGLYKTKPAVHKPWSIKQVRWLRRLAFGKRMSARQISLTNLFLGRSVASISGQIQYLKRQGADK